MVVVRVVPDVVPSAALGADVKLMMSAGGNSVGNAGSNSAGNSGVGSVGSDAGGGSGGSDGDNGAKEDGAVRSTSIGLSRKFRDR